MLSKPKLILYFTFQRLKIYPQDLKFYFSTFITYINFLDDK